MKRFNEVLCSGFFCILVPEIKIVIAFNYPFSGLFNNCRSIDAESSRGGFFRDRKNIEKDTFVWIKIPYKSIR